MGDRFDGPVYSPAEPARLVPLDSVRNRPRWRWPWKELESMSWHRGMFEHEGRKWFGLVWDDGEPVIDRYSRPVLGWTRDGHLRVVQGGCDQVCGSTRVDCYAEGAKVEVGWNPYTGEIRLLGHGGGTIRPPVLDMWGGLP